MDKNRYKLFNSIQVRNELEIPLRQDIFDENCKE